MSNLGTTNVHHQNALLVYGAGGHGKVVCDILLSLGLEIAGFVDDLLQVGSPLGLKILGDGSWLTQQSKKRHIVIALGIGDSYKRGVVAQLCLSNDIHLLTAIHPRASVASSAKLAAGIVVMPNATINADAVIGTGAIVNTGAIVEHDCVLGDFGHVSPNAAMAGGSALGSFSQLGLGASLLPGVRVGNHSLIGAGAVVTKDIPDEVVAMGVPAKVIRKNVFKKAEVNKN